MKYITLLIISILILGWIPTVTAAQIEDIPGEPKEQRVERLFFYISRWSRKYEELSGPAIRELRSMGVDAVAMLMHHLESDDVRERVMMENLINGIGVDCTPYLVEALSYPSAVGRSRAATFLGSVGDARAVQPLADLLAKESDWTAISSAIAGLGQLASRGFHVPSEPVAPFAKHEMEPIRRAAVVAFGYIGDAQTIPLLIEAFNDELFSVRYPAAQALASFGDAAIEPLAGLLRDGDTMRQALACYALGLSRSGKAYDYLVTALSSPEPVVRAHAVEGLRNLGDKRIRSTLYKMRFNELDFAVLGEIEQALASL